MKDSFYRKIFSDLGVLSDLAYRNVVIICKKETFEKLGRKNYPAKATNTDYSVLTMDHYLNCLTGILFFHDRVKKAYFKQGFIPSYMTCVNPDSTKKVRRSFEYIDIDEIYNKGGYREKSILDNLENVKFDYSDGYKVITFIDNQCNDFDYSIKNKNICG